MLDIEVLSAFVEERTGEKDGSPWKFRNQYGAVYLYTRDERKHDFTRELKIPLYNDQAPFLPGKYQLSLSSFYIDKYQNLYLPKHIKLKPVSDK